MLIFPTVWPNPRYLKYGAFSLCCVLQSCKKPIRNQRNKGFTYSSKQSMKSCGSIITKMYGCRVLFTYIYDIIMKITKICLRHKMPDSHIFICCTVRDFCQKTVAERCLVSNIVFFVDQLNSHPLIEGFCLLN